MSKTAIKKPIVSQTRQTRLYLASALVKSEELLERFAKIIESHGANVMKSESLGQKQLFQPIHQQRSLFLLSVFFTATLDTISAIETELRRDDAIERALVTIWRADINQPMRSTKERTDRAPREKESE